MEFSEDPTSSSSSSSRSLISSSTLNRPPFPKSISHWFPVNSNNDEDQPYITSLLSLSSSNLLASSDSEKYSLRIYDKNNINSNQPLININWSNSGRITSINRSPFQSEGGDEDSNHFIATSSSGSLAHFDIRSNPNAPSTLMRVPGGRTPYLSAGSSYSGNLVAAGRELESNEACVDLWDVRQPIAPILTFTESHSDDITSLHFLPPSAASTSNGSSSKTTSHLLTSSTDGLISIIDTSIGENEDDSVLSVGNLGASVARSGWSGYKSLPSNNGGMDVDNEEDTPKLGLPDVWAVSDMQTLATFNTDGFDPILSPIDARGPTSIQPPWSTDYVIDAFDSKSLGMDQEDGLKLFCGDQNGAFSIISISSKDSDLNQTPWRLEALFPSGMNGGHCDIVRCVDWDRRSQTLFTGGEDGRICSWDFSSASSLNANQNQSLSMLPTSISSNDESELSLNGGKDRNGNGSSKKEKRFKPYG